MYTLSTGTATIGLSAHVTFFYTVQRTLDQLARLGLNRATDTHPCQSISQSVISCSGPSVQDYCKVQLMRQQWKDRRNRKVLSVGRQLVPQCYKKIIATRQ